jgi:hypothetical protein
MSVDLDIPPDEVYDPTQDESIGPSRLYATTRTLAPQYIAGQQGSAGGRILDPRGSMTNIRFSEPMVRMRDFREAMARVQLDVSRLSGMIRGLSQTIASQANNNLMMSLFSVILGGPQLDSVTVESITTKEPVTRGSSSSPKAIDAGEYLPATVDIKDTKYKTDIMTLMPFFMSNMGGQTGYGSSTGGGMFGGSNFMMMFMMLMLIKSMNDKEK